MESSPVSSSAAAEGLRRAPETQQAAKAASERRTERQPEREGVQQAREPETERSNLQGQRIGRVINITV